MERSSPGSRSCNVLARDARRKVKAVGKKQKSPKTPTPKSPTPTYSESTQGFAQKQSAIRFVEKLRTCSWAEMESEIELVGQTEVSRAYGLEVGRFDEVLEVLRRAP